MTDTGAAAPARSDLMRFVLANIRDYALLLSLLAVMVFFQFATNGTLFMPVNMTNIILQNSYIVIMALGMLLVIVAGHIDLSVGSVSGFIGAVAAVMMAGASSDWVPVCRKWRRVKAGDVELIHPNLLSRAGKP